MKKCNCKEAELCPFKILYEWLCLTRDDREFVLKQMEWLKSTTERAERKKSPQLGGGLL
jgi:hypothetical protein